MENIFIKLGLSLFPVFVLLAYFWYKDHGEKEPSQLLKKVFFWGVLAIIPVFFVELLSDTFIYTIWPEPPLWYWVIMPFVFVALPEEFAKFLVVKKVAYDHHKFNEIMDGISYCIVASMGFAAFENINYTFQFGLGTGILRAFTAVPAHALFSGLMGYYIGMAKFAKKPALSKKLLKRGLLVGVIFHGLYDFLLMSGIPYLILLVFPLIFYMWTQLHHAIRLANAKRADGLDYF